MIEIKHLTKRYGSHIAVDDLNLTIEPGRIYGFLGPNGAGKSTTMNMITGYIAATEGSVTIDGFDIYKDANKAKQRIGYLPEIPPVYPDMTVLEYLEFVAELKGIPQKDRHEAVDDACITVGISDVAGRLIRNLSKGYRQRVGLAQAIIGKPDIIILDEPTVGLDPAQIIEVRDLIRELGREHTVILSSHILSEISEVCNYVFIISKGKLVAADETRTLLNNISGSQEIDILISASGIDDTDAYTDSVIAAYSALHGVKSVEAVASSEKDTILLTLYATPDTDIRADVFKCAVSNGYMLLNLSSRSKSLEDVFLELTQSEAEEGSTLESAAADEDTLTEETSEGGDA